MNHTNTQKLLPITDCGGRIFTTTAVQAQKKKQRLLMGQKHRSWRAFFTWLKYVPGLARCEQVYLFLALA